MAKRFTATEIWGEDWFLDMPIQYKLFWYYMLSNCDHAGLFKVNLRSFCSLNNVEISPIEIIKYFNTGKDRIREISEKIWLIEDFFLYQYGETFNPNNRVHDSIEKLYMRHNIKMTSIRGLKDLKDRVKDKDKDKDKYSNKNKSQIFKGIEFSEDGKSVIFEDGTSQELGKNQMCYFQNNQLRADQIIKGYIS